MNNDIEYTISPQELLERQGIRFSLKGNWLSVKYCIFCEGGRTKQVYTFGVHKTDGNYNCLRTTCGEASNFWNLLKHFGYDPKQFIKKHSHSQKPERSRKTSYVYRRRT